MTRIRVAIIGGGLAGASLANALFWLPHLDIQVFEAAPEFSERGASIGLSKNTLETLDQILRAAERLLIEEAGAVVSKSARVMMGSGEEAVYRASFLRLLLAPLPDHMLHTNKKLVSQHTSSNGRVEVVFEDGAVDHFDAVIGADGIFSSVRDFVLQDEALEHEASPAGFWDCSNLVPFDKASAALGEEYFREGRQYGWIGHGAFLLHGVLENRTMVQCIVSGTESDPARDRKRVVTRESLDKVFESCEGGPTTNGIIDEHKSTPTYANGRICIVGDAAHAATPWQGAGAGQAIEDAVVLGALFGCISSSEEIDAVFEAFDGVRRPRCQQVIDSSRETGRILCGQIGGVHDVDGFREALAHRWDFLYDFDIARHKEEALAKLEEMKGRD
ncbi:Uu.00g065700.m01.CDS01 [Anthostomella pinea]|uniref:Uu.00g065700.m01.CDS01 n=1 Tax=Anthostomella pinea TaxID=933095 RepID=A0AAI8VUF9_9PEZI|nr:Uu.00g065700.m01.CDS01 [Anthostomella pinea]